jgi:protein phosphatase
MCSDGLSNMVDDDEIRQVLEQPISAEEMADTLVGTANDNGGMDNIAVIIIEPDADEEE